MKQNDHERARDLIDAALVEEIPPPELQWLDLHRNECNSCDHYAALNDRVLQALRAIPIQLPESLADSTCYKVRAHASALEPRSEALWPVWLSVFLSLVLTGLSGHSVALAANWLAAGWGLPSWLVQLAYVWFWVIPSMAAAALLAGRKSISAGFATGTRNEIAVLQG